MMLLTALLALLTTHYSLHYSSGLLELSRLLLSIEELKLYSRRGEKPWAQSSSPLTMGTAGLKIGHDFVKRSLPSFF